LFVIFPSGFLFFKVGSHFLLQRGARGCAALRCGGVAMRCGGVGWCGVGWGGVGWGGVGWGGVGDNGLLWSAHMAANLGQTLPRQPLPLQAVPAPLPRPPPPPWIPARPFVLRKWLLRLQSRRLPTMPTHPASQLLPPSHPPPLPPYIHPVFPLVNLISSEM
jgi:hypothetical protein